MEVHVLASSSKGNALVIKFEDATIMVDAGISARRIVKGLEGVGIAVEDIDGVLVSHEHTDHIKGLPILVKKYHLPVYARQDTWQAISFRDSLSAECRKIMPDSFNIGKVKVEAFAISHDAADPVGFSFYEGRLKCSVATDLGMVTPSVRQALSLSDILVFEANHDVDMLQKGSYPWFLKRRIMSNQGHLSNDDAGLTLAKLDRPAASKVFLAHLSQVNNTPHIAEATVGKILKDQSCEDIELQRTAPDCTKSIKI